MGRANKKQRGEAPRSFRGVAAAEGSRTPSQRALVVALGLVACTSPASAPPAAKIPTPAFSAPVPSAKNGPPAASPKASGAGIGSSEPAKLELEFSRVSDVRISSAAVGKPPKVAFLATGSVLVFDAKGLRTLPAPETGVDATSIELFFGRDDEPRLMGYRLAGGNELAPFYRRFKAGRFQPEPSELGPLAAPKGALYGVLGHADPEVVCRPGSFCLVKRTTGWSRAPAHVVPVKILLAGGAAWALHRDRVERLGEGGWSALEPARAWRGPVSLFVDQEGSPWIVEAESNLVVRRKGNDWEATPAPLSGARAIWGTRSNDVWVVGEGGAAHFDGAAWSSVPGVEGSLSLIVASPPELWLAGQSGVFHGKAPNVHH